MYIALLNWTGAEGNPFTLINSELKKRLEDFKDNIKIINFEEDWSKVIYDLKIRNEIDLVITHQGLGSSATLNNNNFWGEIKLPLLCLHSDHPSLFITNHIADSPYVIHSYCIPEFAEYANSNLNKKNLSVNLAVPSFYSKRNNSEQIGDFFVFPKNIDPIELTINEWIKNLDSSLSNLLIAIANSIKNNYINSIPKDHHVVVEEFLTEENIKADNLEEIRKYLHLQSDKLFRNIASELVINELDSIPLVINGRGWDLFKAKKNKNHHYFDFNNAVDGDFQFYSRYGIIDIVFHANSLHDRTLRAISHRGGFLCNSTINRNSKYKSLFFTGCPRDLMEKAVGVMKYPDLHLNKCRDFGNDLENNNPFENFHSYLIKLISNFNN